MFKIVIKNERGIGLIEVLIALAILGIVAAAFLSGLATASKAIYIADVRTTAESLARSQMEYVKNQPYDDTLPIVYTKISAPPGFSIDDIEALEEMFKVWRDQILSKLYVGWVQGFHDEERDKMGAYLKKDHDGGYILDHPRVILNTIANDIASQDNATWLD